MVLPLEFCKALRKCMDCGKLTPFFVTIEEMSWSCMVYSDEHGKPRVVSDLVVKKPEVKYYEFPFCPECYKKRNERG